MGDEHRCGDASLYGHFRDEPLDASFQKCPIETSESSKTGLSRRPMQGPCATLGDQYRENDKISSQDQGVSARTRKAHHPVNAKLVTPYTLNKERRAKRSLGERWAKTAAKSREKVRKVEW